MPARPDLIYDVGVCNGDDSAYYLHKGYRVVGIEANPLLLARLRERFEADIRDGRYELVPMGIAETAGEAQFWVCDERPEWSSFDRSIASRNGSRNHCVPVRTCRLRSVLERFGTPVYCKIDIEGNDNLCLQDITADTRPKYLSVEVIRGDRQVAVLEDLGYTKFKIISQRTFRQPARAMASLKAHLPRWARSLIIAGEGMVMRNGSDGEWHFPAGSSGPFAEDTPGEWRTAEEALELIRILDIGGDLFDWHDIHATFDSG